MIIGTAGHIDHGKTSLVKALTGVDADRLKEEKARGITIDLGFAYRAAGDGTVDGFVDVPGHEKLVRNMLAGATGIDHVMLVVAADDGPMPQTREHLAIIDLLGLTQGVVVLTKCDLVGAQRVAEVQAEVQALVASTTLAGAPVLAVSCVSGEGIAALQQHLDEARASAAQAAAAPQGHFRLAVDRSFSLPGVGTVVTGTAVAGRVAVGDKLLLSPSGKPVRVRGLHAQNQVAEQGQAGQRLALNLAGVEKTEIHRGDWIVAEPAHAPTRRLDARVRVLPAEGKALAHGTPVHLHLGAQDVTARVMLLEAQAIEPGQSGWVQLELALPGAQLGALRGDRFILRDQSALRTLGGGVVVDAFATPARRRRVQRIARLQAMAQESPAQALAATLALHDANGLDVATWNRLWNLLPPDAQALWQQVPHRTLAVENGRPRAFAPGQLEDIGTRAQAALRSHHQRASDSPGLTAEQLLRGLSPQPPAPVFAALLQDLLAARTLQRGGPYWRLPGHEASLQGPEQKIWERVKPWLQEGGIHPPKLSDLLIRDRNLHPAQVTRVLQKLARMGRLYAVGAEYFILPQHLCALAEAAQRLAQEDEHKRLNVKALREATGMSRHLSMPLVEFFDHIGFTKRDPIGRKIRRDAKEMFQHAE